MNEKENLVIIDADSLIYLVGYDNRDLRIEALGIVALDERIKDILIKSRSANYLGFYGGKGGKNFRYAIAKTVEYKKARRVRKEKEAAARAELEATGVVLEEEWYDYWEPILKEHMKVAWKFSPVFNIEADDACIIAAEAFRDKYEVVTIASPDKDLKQCPVRIWDYGKNVMFDMKVQEARRLLGMQLIEGDSADSIPGMFMAGEVLAKKLMTGFVYKDEETFIKDMQAIYVKHYTITLRDKELKRQEKAFLAEYKVDNDIKRYSGKTKSLALEDFIADDSKLYSKEKSLEIFDEMFALLHMLETEEEGKKHGFILPKVLTETSIDWDEIVAMQEDILLTPDTEEFDFLNEL